MKEAKVKEIIINKQRIEPGDNASVAINVGRLPSDTKINIEAHIFRSENPGPTVLILGGVHGDEINGIEIVRRSLEGNTFYNLLKGDVIAIPLLNVYGFINFSREVPDGKDVNRSFPGSTTGSLASRVARSLTKKILPFADIGMDFHTGGATRYNYPQIRYTRTDKESEALSKVFGAPFILQKPLITKSLRKTARVQKIPMLVFEGGEALRFDGYSIDVGLRGMHRVLQHLGMLEGTPAPRKPAILIKKTLWLRAPYSGLFTWSRSSGAKIRKGERLGTINDLAGLKSIAVVANRDGYIVGHNNTPVVNQGDALFHIGYEYDEVSP